MIDIQDIITAVGQELAAEKGGGAGKENAGVAENAGAAGKSSGGVGKENAGVAEKGNGGGLFLVEAKVLPGDAIEVFIDSDARGEDGRLKGVTVEDCVALTKAIEARFDRDEEDFSLTVSSAGIGQPLRVPRQYLKLVGRSVEVVLGTGVKITGVLEAFGEDNITLSYPEKRRAEGKKKPETVTVTETFPLSEVKTTREYIDFK
jgi:ribosome maturation factor RimP